MVFLQYFVTVLLVVLMLFGPIDHDSKYGMWIRIGYLVLLPVISWWILKWIWDRWMPEENQEDTAVRVLSISIGITLLIFVIMEFSRTSHLANTEYIRTQDGIEEVGNYVKVKGRNWTNIIMMAIFAFLFLWHGLFRKRKY